MEKPVVAGGNPVRKSSNYLVFCAPSIGEEETRAVQDTLKSGWIGTGPRVKRFEEEFKKYVGSTYTIATNSCTAALHLSLIANGIGKGGEVIVTPMTFPASANVIEHVGAKTVFADIDINTFNIDPEKIREKITPKTRAIIPVHFAGRPCNMDEITEIAKENNLVVIEDAAHALGTEYNGEKIGNGKNCACFSFYPTKNITTIEGGMITTNDDAIAEIVMKLRLHGLDVDAWKRFEKTGTQSFETVFPGFKYNMPDVSATVGLCQLRKLNKFLGMREEYARIYEEELKDLGELILPPKEKTENKHSWHLYTVMIKPELLKINRDEFVTAMEMENIGVGINYIAVHLHRYYREKYGFKRGDFPNAEFVSDRIFSLSLSPKMTQEDVYDVVNAVQKIIDYFRK